MTTVTAVVFFLVFIGDSGAVIPEPYPSKEKCIQAGQQVFRDYRESSLKDKLVYLPFMCVQHG